MPVFSDAFCLRTTLASLANQTADPSSFEVVLVDDGSPWEISRMIEPFLPKLNLQYVRQANKGRCPALNEALRRASGRLVMTLDGDVAAHPELIQRHLAHHGAAGAAPVLLGTRLEISWNGFRQLEDSLRTHGPVETWPGSLTSYQRDLTRHGESGQPELILGMLEDDLRAVFFDEEPFKHLWQRLPWIFGWTNTLSVDRRLALEIGGYDEDMRGWAWDDIEFAYRLFLACGEGSNAFTVDRKAISYHLPHYRETSRRYGTHASNLPYVRAKHRVVGFELMENNSYKNTILKLHYYELALSALHRTSLDVVPAVVVEQFASQANGSVLCVGQLPDSARFALAATTFDTFAPNSTSNHRYLGLKTHLADQTFDVALVSDIWRAIVWSDFPFFVEEMLRLAPVVCLTYSMSLRRSELPAGISLIDDLGYVADAVAPYLDVQIQELGGGEHRAAILTRRPDA